MLAQLNQNYPNDVRVIYRHFPLVSIHDKSLLASQAAEAAGLQGKFWEMHDVLFKEQETWAGSSAKPGLTVELFPNYLNTKAQALGLDLTKFTADMNSAAIKAKVDASRQSAESLGLPGTPFLVINGRPYQDAFDYATLSGIVDYFLDLYKKLDVLTGKRFTACPAMTIDAKKSYTATLQTTKGEIKIKLYADKAPFTVNSFVFLAKKGWFDNVPFHRVVAGFVAQTGDPSGTGVGNPGYAIKDEILSSLNFDKAGIVGMANAGAHTNGSQFFITLAAASHLNGNYTVFGEVISGMDVVSKLTLRDASAGGVLADPDMVTKVTIEEK